MISKILLSVLTLHASGAAAIGVKSKAEEHQLRGAPTTGLIHPERQAQLEKIKAMATTWKARAGRWAREAPGASAPVLGHLGDNKLNVAAAKERGEVVEFMARDEISDIPESFDSAKEWPKCAKLINDIRDQSNSVWKSTSELCFLRIIAETFVNSTSSSRRTYGDYVASMA